MCLTTGASAWAQETINYASVGGRVVDAQGAGVPGATVVAHHLDTGVKAEATTDDGGRYRFPYLRVGPYEIAASMNGFTDARRRLALTLGAAFDLPLTLDVAGVASTVSVTADTPVL
jgi:hypothetical protein